MKNSFPQAIINAKIELIYLPPIFYPKTIVNPSYWV